jgi:Transposase IS66 family
VLADLRQMPLAIEAVRRIDEIFAVEREINGVGSEQRHAVRQERIKPLVAALEGWIRTERARLSRHADTAKAIDYMLKRWPAFTRFLDDGRICLTNNAAERALRGIAIGRRAWLFAGSDRGGERAAAMFTLIETAKLNTSIRRLGSPMYSAGSMITRLPGYRSCCPGIGKCPSPTPPLPDPTRPRCSPDAYGVVAPCRSSVSATRSQGNSSMRARIVAKSSAARGRVTFPPVLAARPGSGPMRRQHLRRAHWGLEIGARAGNPLSGVFPDRVSPR